MARKARILFVKNITIAFVEQDIEILTSKFDVRVIDFILSQRSPIGKFTLLVDIILGMLWADLVFLWFADFHAMISVLLAKVFKKKSILVAGGYDVAVVPKMNYGMATSPKRAVVAKLALRCADKVLAVSEFNRNETLRWIPSNKVELIYNAVNCNKFRPGDEKANDLVITVSEVSWLNLNLKGLEVFVKTAACLPGIKFALIGKSSDNCAEYLKEIKPSNVKLICRHVPFEELLEWYQKAKVYCQLSYRESFGVSLAEAMACGCIPVVTNRGALPELAGKIGFYVPYGDPKATGKAIKEALRSDRQIVARKRVQELFHIEKRKKMLVEIIARELRLTKKREISAHNRDAEQALYLTKNAYEKQAKIDQINYYLTCWHHVARKKVMRNVLENLATTPKTELALDLGCGDGWYTEMLMELGFYVIGLDISNSRLTRAKRRLRLADFVLADVSHLPFRRQTFDLIIAAQFLEHMEHPNHTVTILSKPLKSGGRLIVETPCRTNLIDRLVENFLRKRANWGLFIDPTHKHFFSLNQLKQIIKSSNLSIETLQGSVNFNYTLPFVSYIVWHKRRFWFILDVFNKLLKLLKNDWGAIIIIVAKKVRMPPKAEKTVRALEDVI